MADEAREALAQVHDLLGEAWRGTVRESSLLAPHRKRLARVRAHAGTITTLRVDIRWGTDMTETVTLKYGVARVLVAVDHCNA